MLDLPFSNMMTLKQKKKEIERNRRKTRMNRLEFGKNNVKREEDERNKKKFGLQDVNQKL